MKWKIPLVLRTKVLNEHKISHLSFVNFQIISKDDGVLLKDDFKGGATWAYEIGSTSMVCPIIVEDLNQPQQMLVEVVTCTYYVLRPGYLFNVH